MENTVKLQKYNNDKAANLKKAASGAVYQNGSLEKKIDSKQDSDSFIQKANINQNEKASFDKKFNLATAFKNFAQGVVSPVTELFNPKTLLFLGSLKLLTTGLMVATLGSIAPAFVALGAGFGLMECGVGAYNLLKAKNGEDFNKSFYHAGVAAVFGLLAVLSSRWALKSGKLSMGGNLFRTTCRCISETPKKLKETFKRIANGEAWKSFKSGQAWDYIKQEFTSVKTITKGFTKPFHK